MNERLKLLRKQLGASQEEFGRRLGVGKTAISKLEKGENNLTEQMIKLICKEFSVDYQWLISGKGEMFKAIPEEDEVAAYVSELLEDDGSNPLYVIIKEIMHTYNELDIRSQEVLKESCNKLLENLSKRKEG